MFQKLDEVEALFSDLEKRLSSPDVVNNQFQFQKLSKEHASLLEVVAAYREYRKIKQDYEHNLQIIKEDSGEIKELALDENTSLEPEISRLERRLKVLLLPKDPNDDKKYSVRNSSRRRRRRSGYFCGQSIQDVHQICRTDWVDS